MKRIPEPLKAQVDRIAEVIFYLYTESGRQHFTRDGHLPQVGDRWRQPDLAATLRKLADEGPAHFISKWYGRPGDAPLEHHRSRIPDASHKSPLALRGGEG